MCVISNLQKKKSIDFLDMTLTTQIIEEKYWDPPPDTYLFISLKYESIFYDLLIVICQRN